MKQVVAVLCAGVLVTGAPDAWVSHGESAQNEPGCGLDQFTPCASVSYAWSRLFDAGLQLHLDVGQYSFADVPLSNASGVTIIGSGR